MYSRVGPYWIQAIGTVGIYGDTHNIGKKKH